MASHPQHDATDTAFIWLDGNLIPAAGASIPVSDRNCTHGLGLFETLLALDGRPVFWKEHLARLGISLTRLGWHDTTLPSPDDAVRLLEMQPGRTPQPTRLRIDVTGGEGGISRPSEGRSRRVWMTATPLP